MKKILFVDDETLVLQGLRRMLHGMRGEWAMRFANSGAEALSLMAEDPADVLVSDMRMPGINGAELLNEVMQRYPKTIRFILSGYADSEMIMQCVGGTHQFLSKPCDCETLRSTVRRASEMDHCLNNDRMKTLVSRLSTIPSLPSLYFEILRELRSPEATLDKVGEMIAQDPAMTLKILQLVNSAFFGLRRQLTNPTEAVMQLGMETIKSLVLTIHVFSELMCDASGKLPGEKTFQHSLATAAIARQIMRQEKQDRRLLDEAFTAGLLHDVGRLALVANLPEPYAEAVARTRNESISLLDAERAVFGVSHAEVGGYLLGLWGLPVGLVEATAYHHSPADCMDRMFSSLTAVHVANVLQQESLPGGGPELRPQLDQAYLTSVGVGEKIPVWREALRQERLT